MYARLGNKIGTMSAKEEDFAQPEFWDSRYRSGSTPWDQAAIPQALMSYLQKQQEPTRRVLVPGCGSGYELPLFLQRGYDVFGIDFSEAAVSRARSQLSKDQSDRIIHGDFFNHRFPHLFDLMYERAFLCALSPARWRDYAARVAELLRPGGTLAGLFFYGVEPEPPPFPITDGGAADLFGSQFRLVNSELVHDSLELYHGQLRWQEWQRKA
jgi:SAM-dependent methyltransferase